MVSPRGHIGARQGEQFGERKRESEAICRVEQPPKRRRLTRACAVGTPTSFLQDKGQDGYGGDPQGCEPVVLAQDFPKMLFKMRDGGVAPQLPLLGLLALCVGGAIVLAVEHDRTGVRAVEAVGIVESVAHG